MDKKRIKKISLIILVMVLLVSFFGCKKDNEEHKPIEIPVTSIEIQGSSNVTVGSTVAYSATVLPDNATNITVTWTVTPKGGEATIDAQGNLNATKAGGVTIRATAANGLFVEKNIVILSSSVPVSAVTIQGASTLAHGARETYYINVEPANATYANVTWSIIGGNGNIDKSGRLAPKAAGELTIQVRVDGVTSTKKITITPYQGSVSEIKVLSNRVDLRNTVFRDYEREFEALFPMYNVIFETLLDYENNSRMRLQGGDYGDVLLIPSSVSAKNLSYYFKPIGDLAPLSQSWRYVSQKSFEGTVYGLPTYGSVNGILYNKKVFRNAGINYIPTTPQEFLNAMAVIKNAFQNDANFVAPFYTNKKDSWPLDQWQGNVSSVSGNPNYYYNLLPNDRNAFTEGSPHYIVYQLLYDLVDQSLIENDPSTTNWERSKIDFVKGNIGAMMVGSWAVSQFIDVAQKVRDGTFIFDDGTPGEQSNLANPEDVGYMPFPYTNPDGKVYSAHASDFFMGISNKTKVESGANDFMMWFLRESGFYQLNGGIPPRTDMEFPAVIQTFQTLGVILFEETAPTTDMVGKLDLVEANSSIVLWNPDWKNDLFEDAFFHRKTYNQIANELNSLWNEGIDLTF